MLVLLGVIVAAGSAGAGQEPLAGRGLARLGENRASIIFRPQVALPPELGGSCPEPASIRLATSDADSGEIPLPCRGWRPRSTGLLFRTPKALRSEPLRVGIRFRSGSLQIRLRGDAVPDGRNASWIEVRLAVGDRAFCGRLEVRGSRHGQAVARGTSQLCQELRPRPNFILINLDDARVDGVDLMPQVQSRIVNEGRSFSNAFTPTSICCPSRASLLTGLYARNHGVRNVSGVIGGADVFRETGADQQTIAVWLRDAGYRTGLFGKYLNDYWRKTEAGLGPNGSFYRPPGWDRWWALVSPEHYGGVHGETYEVIDETGAIRIYDDHETDAQYVTDLGAQTLRDFVAESAAAGEPFFAYWAAYAPHVETSNFVAAPAARHYGTLESLAPWRPNSWFEDDIGDKPRWIASMPTWPAITDIMRVRGYEALLSVDEQIGEILDQLLELGIDRDTVVIFTSDNGVGWGEHRIFAMLKNCPYEECQRVPLAIRYPRAIREPSVVSGTAALNIDIAPTIAALAGVSAPTTLDGVSLDGWLFDREDRTSRSDYSLEAWRVQRDDYISYSGQMADGDRLRLYYGNPRAQPRASRLYEFDSGDGVTAGSIAVPIEDFAPLTIHKLAVAVKLSVPDISLELSNTRLTIVDETPQHFGVYWWEEVDRYDSIKPRNTPPDYAGVRDVSGDFTYLEYETGERELYDLRIDPYQLENVANDPNYATEQERLRLRLKELLGEAE
jgi:N-acetylglucosamine-6-sulfatase